MINEDEAKQRRCCGPEGCGCKKPDSYHEDGNDVIIISNTERYCAGPDCMGWRKSGSKFKDNQGKLHDRNLTDMGEWIDVGYCGLAGKPQ